MACSNWHRATATAEWPPIPSLQQAEFDSETFGYTATRHQREVGTGYFDAIATAISAGQASTVALKESTEAAQFVAAQ